MHAAAECKDRALPAGHERREPRRSAPTTPRPNDAISAWNHHGDYHLPHITFGDWPSASQLRGIVDNIMTNYG
ncbi:Protein of unknown function [Propionibacterium freudenreichii]|nr:Protein of unknown function [Propionibacterium freudenreichii]